MSESYYKYKKNKTDYTKNQESKASKNLSRTEEIQKLKLKLGSLANELYKSKQISKPLTNQMFKLINARTRLPKLQDAYHNLKSIDHKFKSEDAEDRKNITKATGKSFTKKEFKQLGETSKQEYTVYRKYVLDIIKNDGTEKKEEEKQYRDITSKVVGLYKIPKLIKGDLAYFISMPYVKTANVVKVVVNQLDMSSKQYRYQSVRHTASGIEYDKAWNMQFEYRGLNVEMNDEIPFQCVPNALYKMYGNRDNGRDKFIRTIADGGLEYVKHQLDIGGMSAYLDVLDPDEEPQIRDGFKGYSPMDILTFCNDHKIRCFGYDWKLEQFISNKDLAISFHSHLPAFVFYFNDNHIYLITDKDLRHALLNNNTTVNISELAKEKKKKTFEREIKINIPFQDWETLDSCNIYITEERQVHKIFYDQICKGIVHNSKIAMSEKEGIVKFQYIPSDRKKKKMIIYNPDVITVIDTIRMLNPNEEIEIADEDTKDVSKNDVYKFKNQRIHTLAREYCDKEFGGIPKSTFNTEGDYIFHSQFIRNCAFNGWIQKPNSDNLHAFDYNKHYTSVFMGQDIKFGWPIYNVFDEVKPFDGKIETGFYYVETKNFFPFHGNGFYDADLIFYALVKKIITKTDVKLQYKSSYELQPNHYEKFVKSVYDNFQSPKKAINGMLGLLGHDYSNSNRHHFTNNSRYAMMEAAANTDYQIKYIYHENFDQSNDEPIDIDNIEISNYLSTEKPLCYHLYNMKRNKKFQNELPFFYKVYNCSAIKMHQLATNVGGSLCAIFTDTIIIEGDHNKPSCNKDIIGGIRETDIKEFTNLIEYRNRTDNYFKERPTKMVLQDIEEFKLDGKGCFITGLAGTGKSYLCRKLQKKLGEGNYGVCSSTHKSALIIGGKTVYNLFNINPKDHTYIKSTVDKVKESGIKYIFIDEISMINSKVFGVLHDIKKKYDFKFIMIGDWGQLESVEDKHYDIEASQLFCELVDGQKLELKLNYRAMKDPLFKLFSEDLMKAREGETIDFSTYGTQLCRKSICWTNRKRKAINEEWNLKMSKDNPYITINNIRVYKNLPIISKKTRTIDDNEVKNNEEFTVRSFDKDTITIKSAITKQKINITHKDFKDFDLAYCITVHVSQGSSYDFPYSIHEYDMMDKRLLYTAMSRSTCKQNINFVKSYHKLQIGYIYKITCLVNNKFYIGSTKTSLEQRRNEHFVAKDNSLLHLDIRKYGNENFTIELVKTIEFVEEDTLLIAETTMMIELGSLDNQYNEKVSIDLQNLI